MNEQNFNGDNGQYAAQDIPDANQDGQEDYGHQGEDP